MFMPPPAPRRRPMFAVSAAAHTALAAVLVVPPLFATPEPPEPDGVVKIEAIPVLTIDAGARPPGDSLRRGSEGGSRARAGRASVAGARPPVVQPTGVGSVLPDPTGGDEAEFTFEGSGERNDPPGSIGSGSDDEGGGGPGCPGCSVISATAPGVKGPVPVETHSPVYPDLARRAHVEGVVLLEAIIGVDGSVRDVRVLRSASPLLESAALEAVRTWRYRPARIGERPVAVYLSVVVTFTLKNL